MWMNELCYWQTPSQEKNSPDGNDIATLKKNNYTGYISQINNADVISL